MHRHNASVHTGRYQVLKVDAGSVLVNDACATVQQIVESVRKVETIMGEISAAGDRQVAGIGLIGRAIDVMDQMTQQNSALVEEASAAAGSLSDQTAQLSDTLQVFKLGDGTLSQTSYPREYPAPGARLAPLTGA
jgi:methyl-accepting chemotaxis protein